MDPSEPASECGANEVAGGGYAATAIALFENDESLLACADGGSNKGASGRFIVIQVATSQYVMLETSNSTNPPPPTQALTPSAYTIINEGENKENLCSFPVARPIAILQVQQFGLSDAQQIAVSGTVTIDSVGPRSIAGSFNVLLGGPYGQTGSSREEPPRFDLADLECNGWRPLMFSPILRRLKRRGTACSSPAWRLPDGNGADDAPRTQFADEAQPDPIRASRSESCATALRRVRGRSVTGVSSLSCIGRSDSCEAERAALVRFDVYQDVSPEEPADIPDASTSSTFAVVPTLSEGERTSLAAGGRCRVDLSDHLPEHEALLDYLIERSVIAWTRSQG
jgi:hypothetical protein